MFQHGIVKQFSFGIESYHDTYPAAESVFRIALYGTTYESAVFFGRIEGQGIALRYGDFILLFYGVIVKFRRYVFYGALKFGRFRCGNRIFRIFVGSRQSNSCDEAYNRQRQQDVG